MLIKKTELVTAIALWVLAEFSQNAEGRLGVQESNLRVMSARNRRFIDQFDASISGTLQISNDVVRLESYVVETFTLLFDGLSNSTVRARWFKELDVNACYIEHCYADFLGGDFRNDRFSKSKSIAIVWNSCIEALYRDADMVDLLDHDNRLVS
jgi:hypothetical protein